MSWYSNSVLHFEVSLSMSNVCIAKKLFCRITKFMPQLFVITFWENVVFTNILILTMKLMAVPKWMTEMKVSDKSDTFKNSMSKVSKRIKVQQSFVDFIFKKCKFRNQNFHTSTVRPLQWHGKSLKIAPKWPFSISNRPIFFLVALKGQGLDYM